MLRPLINAISHCISVLFKFEMSSISIATESDMNHFVSIWCFFVNLSIFFPGDIYILMDAFALEK